MLQHATQSTSLSRRYFCNDSVIWGFLFGISDHVYVCARACFLMLVLTGCKYGMLPTECMFVPRMGDAGSTPPFCVWSCASRTLPSTCSFVLWFSSILQSLLPHPNVNHQTLSTQFCRFFSPCFSLHRFLHNMFVKNWMHPCRVHINLLRMYVYVCVFLYNNNNSYNYN